MARTEKNFKSMLMDKGMVGNLFGTKEKEH